MVSSGKSKRGLLIGIAVVMVAGGVAAVLLMRAPPGEPSSRPSEIPSSSAKIYTHFESPPEVKIHEVGKGFEIINTDPKLTGKTVEVEGVMPSGERVKYKVTLPPPIASVPAP